VIVDREETIRDLFVLVRRLARRVTRVVPAADFDDLIGDGCVGLIRAVDTFDPQRGTLEGYARRLIVGAMLNGLRRLDPVSERARRTMRETERERLRLAHSRGSLPSLHEMEAHNSKLHAARIAVFRHSPLSLEATFTSDGPAFADLGSDPAIAAVAAGERREVLEAIALLPERQRKVIALHYYSQISLHAIGARLNVSPQRVSQLHLRALAELRAKLASQ
jgi:RNA polymerase sigma factor for flagellar operon FliA